MADILSRCTPNGECLEWAGAKSKAGYGQVRIKGHLHYTHRYAWAAKNGEIPAGLLVCHGCDNRACCNPAHLFLGTHADNSSDMVAKGRCISRGRPGEEHGCAKLTEATVRSIRASTESYSSLAGKYGVHPSTIGKIRRGANWSHVHG